MIDTVRTVRSEDLETLLTELLALPTRSTPTEHLILAIQVVLLERDLDRLATLDLEEWMNQ